MPIQYTERRAKSSLGASLRGNRWMWLVQSEFVDAFGVMRLHALRAPGYSVRVDDPRGSRNPEIGLCVQCTYMREIRSDRGSVFYQCQLAATNSAFPKYPRLPVIRCLGYKPNAAEGATE